MDNLGGAAEAAGEVPTLLALPHDLLLRIFQQRDHQGRQILTLEEHVRCQAVCKAWREALSRKHLPIQSLKLDQCSPHQDAISHWALLQQPAVEEVKLHCHHRWGNEFPKLDLFLDTLLSIYPSSDSKSLEMLVTPVDLALCALSELSLTGLTRLCIETYSEVSKLDCLGRLESLRSLSICAFNSEVRLAGPVLSLPSLTSLHIRAWNLVEVSTPLPLLRRLSMELLRAASGRVWMGSQLAGPAEQRAVVVWKTAPPGWQQAEQEQQQLLLLFQERPVLLPCLVELSIEGSYPHVDLALAPALTSLQLKRAESLTGVQGVGGLPQLAALSLGTKGWSAAAENPYLQAALLLRQAPPSLRALSIGLGRLVCPELWAAIGALSQLTQLRLCGCCWQWPWPRDEWVETAEARCRALGILSMAHTPAEVLNWHNMP